MIRRSRLAFAALALLAASCTPPPRPAPAPPPPPAGPPPPPPFTATEVWTSQPGVVLRGETASTTLPWAFMHLLVVRVDSAELVVRCAVCAGGPVGRVRRDRVTHQVRTPLQARDLELADFALAVREAARRKDFPALRAVMARDFTWSLTYPDGALEAVSAWQSYRASDLERLPGLLDRGIVSTTGGVWAAPPEFATVRGYNDLRAGFRRGANGWEFSFLVRSSL